MAARRWSCREISKKSSAAAWRSKGSENWKFALRSCWLNYPHILKGSRFDFHPPKGLKAQGKVKHSQVQRLMSPKSLVKEGRMEGISEGNCAQGFFDEFET